jgi:hypothetical protein
MGINNLPSALQSVIQLGYLEHKFRLPLVAKLGFRSIADQEPFMAKIGETITKTRTGLLPAITTPMAPAANSDFTSGLTPQNYGVEQYVLAINQFAGNQMLNIVTDQVAIADLYLRNAYTLGEQAFRSVDTLAQQALFNTYLGGNTRVRTTLGAAGVTISVDDIRGFQNTLNGAGQVVPVSSSFPVNVVVGADVYSLTSSAADGTNVSTAPGGVSGTLTFATSVTVSDGTAGNAVVSAIAPVVIRPSTTSSNVMANTTLAISAANDINLGKLTMEMVLLGKSTMSANGVQPVAESGLYHLYVDPFQATGLYNDPAFQQFFRGQVNTEEYRRGIIAQTLGVRIIETNLNPIQNLAGVGSVHRGILCGQGALVEGQFTAKAYQEALNMDDGMIVMSEGIAHVTREPLDALKQVVTQSWSYIGGFAVPSDVLTNPNTIPTSNNSSFKRAIILESL